MRLLFITPSYPPMLGGGEHYVQSLANELAHRGHELTVVTSAIAQPADFWRGATVTPHPASAVEDDVTVLRLPVHALPLGRAAQLALRKAMVLVSLLGPFTAPLLAQAGRAFPWIMGLDDALTSIPRPDLLHSFNISWECGLLAGQSLSQALSLPHVVTPFFHAGAPGQHRVWRNNTMPHQRRALAAADAVLALSAAERAGLLRLGVQPEIVQVVGAASDAPAATQIAPDSALIRQLEQLADPLILFVGRTDRDKGALTAMQAVALLHRQNISCHLVLAGQPSGEAVRLVQRYRNAGAPIQLLGAVDEATKQWLLQHCVALVLPSRVESFGLVLLEAWQWGKPVIAADIGGPQSLVRPGENGLLIPWGDASALAAALQTLLANPAYAQRLGEAGRLRAAQTFTWPQVADRVEAVYRTVLTQRASQGA